jgi:hypothetical protein
MKKIIYVLSLAIMFSSCDKLVVEKVYTSLDSETLYENVEGCEAALTGVYGELSKHQYYGTVFPQMAQNLCGIYTTEGTQIDNKFGNNAGTYFINWHWEAIWQVVARTNNVIFYVNKSTINQTVKNRILGEVYFIRAKSYFDLVRLWGGVPLRLEPSTASTLHMARSTTAQVYDQIIKDLAEAKKLLPEPAGAPLGRPHKYAANALAQKVYLTMAGNDPTSPNWQKSIDEGLVVVNSLSYTLVRPYSKLWQVANKNSKEGIFEIQGSVINTGDGASLTRFFLPGFPSTNLTPLADTWGRGKVNKEVYDGHMSQYPNDPRIEITYLDSSYKNRTGANSTNIYPIAKTGRNSFTFIKKYVDAAYTGTSSNTNIIYMRYAEVLLMLAEAYNEIGNSSQAHTYINLVLARARDLNGNGINEANEISPANWVSMSQPEFRDRIMKEYRYELLGELDEYFQVRRRGQAYFKSILDAHNAYAPTIANVSNTNGFDYLVLTDAATMTRIMLLPIPLSEMSANNLITQTDQNPGY